MTSMSSLSAASMLSPNQRMQQALQTAVTSGTVSSTDQSALSSALTSIDSSMKSSKPGAGGDPASKISDLIDQQVSDGKLTDDQATELKQLFTDNAPKAPGDSDDQGTSDQLSSVDGTNATGGTSGTHRAHHMHHAGGPPPSDDGSDDTTSDSTTSATSTDATGTASASSTDANSQIEKMIAFLKKLEEANSSTTNYGSDGSSTASNYQSLLVDSAA